MLKLHIGFGFIICVGFLLGGCDQSNETASALVVLKTDNNCIFSPTPKLSFDSTMSKLDNMGHMHYVVYLADGGSIKVVNYSDSITVESTTSIFVYDEALKQSFFLKSDDVITVDRQKANGERNGV